MFICFGHFLSYHSHVCPCIIYTYEPAPYTGLKTTAKAAHTKNYYLRIDMKLNVSPFSEKNNGRF